MSSQSKKAVLAAGVVVLLIGAFFFGRNSTPETEEQVGEPAQQGRTSQSEQGAIQAATTFARILPGPSGDVEAYLRAMEDIAASEWRARSQELANNAVAFVADRYGEEGRISFQPVRYRVDSFSSQRAKVSIWGLVLASSSEGAEIEESWLTATLTLLWAGDEWKLNGQASGGGPTPELLHTDDELTADQLAGFQDYKSAESP
jgi:hypothetical protein